MTVPGESNKLVGMIAHGLRKKYITLTCDVGYKFVIIYDAFKKNFFAKNNADRRRFRNIPAMLQHLLGLRGLPIFEITAVHGIELMSVAAYGDSYAR